MTPEQSTPRPDPTSTEAEVGDSGSDLGPQTGAKEPWTRNHKIAVWSASIATLGVVIALFAAFPQLRQRWEHPLLIQTTSTTFRFPATAPSAEQDAARLTAETAKDSEALREQNHVTRLDDAESGKTFAEIPVGPFGFISGSTLTELDPAGPYHRLLGQLAVDADGYLREFEIQKLGDGSGLVVGYVGSETLERLREGLLPNSDLTLYSYRWKDAPNVVALPITRLKCTRSRDLDVENLPGNQHGKFIGIEALDCSTL